MFTANQSDGVQVCAGVQACRRAGVQATRVLWLLGIGWVWTEKLRREAPQSCHGSH